MSPLAGPESAAPSARKPTVLVIDDEPSMQAYLNRLLVAEGYGVASAADGAEALRAIAAVAPDVVLLDVGLPEIDGFEVCRRVRRDAATRLLPVIIVTGGDSRDARVVGLDAGADDFLTKPIDSAELLARVRSLVRIKQFTDDLDSAAAIITTLATMIEARDGVSAGHCSRMANYSTAVGRALSLDAGALQVLFRGGFLHDIGMLAVPESVLRKAGRLEPEEYELVKSHTTIGDGLCANLRSLHAVRPVVRSHHERLDGSGYPDGLRGAAIPLAAQIMGVVDVYEAMTAPRPYQRPYAPEAALEELRAQVARGWRDRDLVEALAGVVGATNPS